MKHPVPRTFFLSLFLLAGISLSLPAAAYSASGEPKASGSYVFTELAGEVPEATGGMLTSVFSSYSIDVEGDTLTIYVTGSEPQKAELTLAEENVVPPGLEVEPCSRYTVTGDAQTVSYYISEEYFYFDLAEIMQGFLNADAPVYAVFHKDPGAQLNNLLSSLFGGGSSVGEEKETEEGAVAAPDERVFSKEELLGEWVNIENYDELTLEDSGGDINAGSMSMHLNSWSVDGSTLLINDGKKNSIPSNFQLESKMNITEEDGVLRLTSRDGSLCFMRPETVPMPLVSLKETASGELIDVTVDSVDLLWDMPSDIKQAFRHHDEALVDHSPRADGQVLVKLSFRVFNKSKNAIELPGFVPDLLRITLEYADGYRFTSDGSDGPVYFTDGTNYYCRAHGGYGYQFTVSPLQEKSFTVYIRCPEIVGKKPDAGLNVVFLSHHDTAKAFYFRCRLYGNDQADTGDAAPEAAAG